MVTKARSTHTEQWTLVLDKPGVELYHVLLTFRAWQDDGQWVSVCEELAVASQGASGGDAIEKVIEATVLYLNTLEDVGERRRVFDERDIEVELGLPERRRAPIPVEHFNETVATRLVGLTEAAATSGR